MNNYETIQITDFDDTLFPTSWIKNNNIDIIKMYNDPYFKNLDLLLSKFLNEKNIYIVTNASEFWILQCLDILPLTKKSIDNNNVIIVSARDLYENTHNINSWKINAFKKIMDNHINNNNFNIVSYGDANYEYMGLLNLDDYLKSKNKNYLLKNVKFIDYPNSEELIAQLHTLNNIRDKIINDKNYVDINFNVNKKID